MYVASIVIALFALGDAATLKANSKAGSRLLQQSRKLENNNYLSWVKDYSIKFAGCSSIPKVSDEDEGGSMTTTLLAQFQLCPSDSCDKCKEGGDYVADMLNFIMAQQEATQNHREYACESQLNECQNECGGDDDGCEYQCMYNAGQSDCYNEEEEEEDYQDLIQCQAMDGAEDNNGNAQYYVGAHCVDDGVYLETFTDASCTEVAPDGTFYSINGYNLPSSNLVSDDCISCLEMVQDGDDNYGQEQVMETCTDLYQGSSKCEENLEYQYADTSGCELIQTTLPALNGDVKTTSNNGASWFFFLTTLAVGAYAMMLHKKMQRSESDYTGGQFS